MKTETPKTIYLKDYKPYPFQILHNDLNFDLHEGYTIVTNIMQIQPQGDVQELFLNGEDLELLEIKKDDESVQDYKIDDKGLTLRGPFNSVFTLVIKTRIKPETNTRLEGLYKSNNTYCTQCEAEGFRRITYYPDRPDVLAKFTTRIEASEKHYPVLLSNGNRIDHGKAEHGRHFSIWHDPFPKPCYLFALVAGKLNHIQDQFITKSGRKVKLFIYVRPGDENQCAHAMESLKKSMKWEEDVYGLEYDLDIFNIVAVSDFNMGAMENKSLNIFNTALVLAHQETATDDDFMRVESVIAHEYFHNWSGNRVTCRDWFQLSLKEGLTVFRDQEFSSDMHSRGVQRIDDVQQLRRMQFPEDAGPMAHPIRPDQYIEINNFYTPTVYEKGAEVIRMIHTILGPENYRKGTNLYFKRHDGQAATCEDFIKAMEEASGENLSQFRLWYEQAGTPVVTFRGIYHKESKTYTVELAQNLAPTPGQPVKKPMHIPVRIGFLDSKGHEIKDTLLHVTKPQQSFIIEDISEAPVPSVLRHFSAPVVLKAEQTAQELAFLMAHDTDAFNRWEASQNLSLMAINGNAQDEYIRAYGALLEDIKDTALTARSMSLPSVSLIGQAQGENVDPEDINQRRQNVLIALKSYHKKKLEILYSDFSKEGNFFEVTAQAMGKRALKNATLEILTANMGSNCRARAKAQYDGASNMTDRIAALHVLSRIECDEAEKVFADFYDRFKTYPLVVDKWFALQASGARANVIKTLNKLRSHADFNIKNPNRVRSLYASFAMNNPVAFHAKDGSGYEFLTQGIIELNGVNPQIAARLLTPLKEWKRYTQDRQAKMKACLEEILKTPNLSPDVYEIASKSVQ